MNKFWVILSHTYMTRLKTKSFLISTLVTLLFIFGLANIEKIIDLFADDEADKIAVIDESGELFPPLNEGVKAANEDIELVAFSESEAAGKKAVEEEEYEGLLIVSLNDENLPEAAYFSNEISEFGPKSELELQLQQLKMVLATNQLGIEQAQIAQINEPVAFHAEAFDKSAKTDEELNQARGIVYVMLFLLYMVVALYGQMIATDVATEKSSRVMEILISSASPVTHMFAKILGIALLGLTQIVVFIGLGFALISSKKDELTGGIFEFFGIQDTSASIYIYAIVFFLLGYLLYATLAAMLGSLISRVEDVQQIILPMIFPVIIAFFIAMFGISMPDAKFITISSFIPFFTPMVMFLRVGMLNVPIWEVALSIGLLVVTIAILAVIGARVYKGGVLMYGRSSSLKDIKKAMELSKKDSK